MRTPEILLVDRDDNTCALVEEALRSLDVTLVRAPSCEAAWCMLQRDPIALVIMGNDRDDATRLDLLRSMKDSPDTRFIHSLVLLQRDSESRTVATLDAGADDVVSLPVSAAHLRARVRTCLSRTAAQPCGRTLQVGELVLDEDRFRILSGERVIDVSPREFQLMAFLMRNVGHVHDRERLLREVWDRRGGISPRTVDVHVRRLRAALERIGCEHYLQTVRGVGYRFSARVGENKLDAPPGDESIGM